MANKRGDRPGFAEGAAPVGRRFRRADPTELQSLIEAILARRRSVEEEYRVAARQAELKRRAAARTLATQLGKWIAARTRLRAAVIEIDAMLVPLGMYLSMADGSAHPVDLAAVEIRLYVKGRGCEGSLDITVAGDGRQSVYDTGGGGAARRAALPDITRVTVEDYRATVLVYLERAFPCEAPAAPCCYCGRILATAEDAF